MFSPNQLYDYLRYYCISNKKNTTVRHFIKDGSKNLDDLTPAYNIYTEGEVFDAIVLDNGDQLREKTGCLDMFDQEPVDINAYYNETYKIYSKLYPGMMQLSFSPHDFVFARSRAIYTPIMCHSERNSDDVKLFDDNFYTTVHFWSNAILSRYWFSHYELLHAVSSLSKPKRLGTYIRDTSGTRNYRANLLKLIKSDKNINSVYCPALSSNNISNEVSSNASATVEWTDHNKFDIHLVAETLFDTEKTHLTEKVFKPIVMYQPFILFAGPNSLQYMKSYGFKTFGEIWDESYDTELNAEKRFAKISKVLLYISNLNEDNYSRMLAKTKKIVDFNRKHFYSEKFKKILLSELNIGIDNALERQEQNFYDIPGGTLFHYHDLYHKITGIIPDSHNPIVSLHNSLQYAMDKSETVGKAIIKKYGHLL